VQKNEKWELRIKSVHPKAAPCGKNEIAGIGALGVPMHGLASLNGLAFLCTERRPRRADIPQSRKAVKPQNRKTAKQKSSHPRPHPAD